jgi:molybdenum cofactor synthesis domain-containing protein
MRPIKQTLPFDDALSILLDAAVPTEGTERVVLSNADGRVVAADVVAAVDVPPFTRAAMDGYAVLAADTLGASVQAPRTLRVVDRVFTGQVPDLAIRTGVCVEVATGAPMPDGADAVVMVEQTVRASIDEIRVLAPVNPGQNVGRRGADIAAGQVVVTTGDVLTPSRLGAIAAVGATDVEVFQRPRVAIISTGDEIAEPGQPLAPGQVYDINRVTIAAVVIRHGGTATALPIASDDLDDLSSAVDRALQHHVIVFSGGSSVGERDLILDVLRARGEVIFHGIAVKPGKPMAFGRIGRTPVLGMPGYPASCLSNAYMLLVPFLRKMARLPPWQPITRTMPLARRVSSVAGRHQFYTVRIVDDRADPVFKTSGDITSMAKADGYIEIPSETENVEAGTIVTVKLF